MKVTLLNYTPLKYCSFAIRTCWQSHDKGDGGGDKDKELINRVGNKLKHSSTLEHLNYTFYIEGVSRALLQELSRHRHASLSVKSTRYTLKELIRDSKNIEDYLVKTGNEEVDKASLLSLLRLVEILREGTSLDIAKYCLPESYKTSLTYTINARSLQNFLALRSSKQALWEIRKLSVALFNALPEDHKFIFVDLLRQNLQE